MMTSDDIVDEVRDARDAYARQFNYDLEAIYRDLKEKERKSGRTLVSLPPRRVEPIAASPVVVAPGES